MRWHEVIAEGRMADAARDAILDFLAPLKSQGIGKVTVKQILDNIGTSPELAGIQLDANFVMDTVQGLKMVSKIQPDPDNGEMTLFLDTPVGDRQVSPEEAEKEKADINKAALRTLDKQKK